MPVVVRSEKQGDERDALLSYLEAQRGGLRRSVYGLTEEQARSVPSASALSLTGLIKHVAQGERDSLRTMRGEMQQIDAAKMKEWEAGFLPREDETVDELIAFYGKVAHDTETAVRQLDSLDVTFDAPKAPWDEGGPRSWRWGLLHLIEESARHAGHADMIRESIDGKGAFDLVFETGAMPEPDWSALDG